jgi:CPA2 family monovalent cation:H+ antiporter-2
MLFLAAAGVIVPLFHRARMSAVLGFLMVGVALGPYGVGRLTETYPWLWYVTFDDPQRATIAAELGIVFLLFLLGLELSLRRLVELRRYILGVGLVQVAATTVAIGLLVRWLVAVPPTGIILGLCLALSSTAIVMQILVEQRRAATQVGRIALAVLLFQDLMVVPILFIVGLLAGGPGRSVFELIAPFVYALGAVAAIMLAGRYVVRPLLSIAGATGSRDLIMAITLLIVIGISAATGAAGLSAALGAFLAGLLLSESEYRHHIEIDLEPFKGLLLGIFFITVGTSVDLRLVVEQAGPILLALVVLIAVKAGIVYGAARMFGVARGTAGETALLLAQAGEFAFVVIALATRDRLLDLQLATAAVAVAALSMMVTPALAMLGRALARRLAPLDHAQNVPGADGAEFADHVVIGGFGRVGQTVARMLEAENVPFVALDGNGALVTEQRKAGRAVYFGDASRSELLERAHAHTARAFVATLDAPGAAERMVKAVRQIRPDARVFARAKDADHALRLAALGAEAIPETVEASLQLSGRVLEALGVPDEAVEQRLDEARRQELGRLAERPL